MKCFIKWLNLKRSDKSKYSKNWCRKLGIMERRFYDMVQLCNQFKQLLKSLKLSSNQERRLKLSKNEVIELKEMKEKLLNVPRKRKILNADLNHLDEEDDFNEMDVKEIEFKLGRSGSILGDISNKEMSLEDHILYVLGISLGLYPQFAIPDDNNPHRKDSEQFFHTKDKQFLCLHPNSFFGLYPQLLRDRLFAGKQPYMLVYVGLLETIKPYLLNSTKVPAVPTLLLTAELDTDSRCSKIVADGWLEMKFDRAQDALALICSAVSIRNSFYELMEFYLSQDSEFDQDQKQMLIDQFRSQIVSFFHREIECSLKYIVNADRQLMYSKNAGNVSDIPADFLLMLGEDLESKFNPKKGGFNITPYLTYGCLIDKRRDILDQPYLKTHFTCPSCNIHMICTPGKQIAHASSCKQEMTVPEDTKEEPEEKEDKKPKVAYKCNICNEELYLSMTEILRHKNSHNL